MFLFLGFPSQNPGSNRCFGKVSTTLRVAKFYHLYWGRLPAHPNPLISHCGQTPARSIDSLENDRSLNPQAKSKPRHAWPGVLPLQSLLLTTNPPSCKE